MKTRFQTFFVAIAVGFLSGCSPPEGTLKGTLVDGGKPVGCEGQQVSLSFHPMKPDGSFDASNCCTAVLNADASFEFVASGGTLSPGQYRVVIASPTGPPSTGKQKKKVDRFAGHSTFATSKLTLTVVAGKNDVVLDLSKPAG